MLTNNQRKKIKVYLIEHDMKQKDLADMLNVSPQHLNNILTGKDENLVLEYKIFNALQIDTRTDSR